jgi:hypothetical protein
MSENLQGALRLGSPSDLYYYDSRNTHKQSIPTVVSNRFVQALNNLRQGSTTFIISPDQGVSDIILGVKLPEHGVGGVNYTDLALPRGWLYALIDRISVRYAGSSQYFWLGSQLLIENLRECPNAYVRDKLFEMGGAGLLGSTTSGAGEFVGDNMYAYAYLNLPHNSPNGGPLKCAPFPSEMLSSAIVVTVEMRNLQSIFSSANASGSITGAPSSLESGYFQVKQVHANDRGDLMVASADRSKAYSFPTKCFYQNEITVNIPANATTQGSQYNALLTGFRGGQVRDIIMWMTENADTDPAVTTAPFVKNYTNFALPHDLTVTYNGTVYYQAAGTSCIMFNLISTETPSSLEATVLSISGGDIAETAAIRHWVEVPFGQVYAQQSGSHMFVAGKTVQSAVVNAAFSVPDATKAYTAHFVYVYNCVMLIADGTASYAF